MGTTKFSSLVSIPEEETKFWEGTGTTLLDRDLIKIVGGGIVYTIANLTGPGVTIDLYRLYDKRPDLKSNLLASLTELKDWASMKGRIYQKYNIAIRFEKFRLERGDLLRLESQLKLAMSKSLGLKKESSSRYI